METGLAFWAAAIAVVCALVAAIAVRRNSQRIEAAQRDAREEIERLRSFIAVSSDWTWEQDDRFRFTYLSGSIESVLGVGPETFIGKTRRQVTPDALDEATFAAHEEALAAHAPIRNLRMRHLRPDGTIRYVEIDGNPVFDDAGVFSGYRGVGRDITGLVEAEREALDTQQRFMTALEALPDAISFWDHTDRLRFFNSACIDFAPGAKELLQVGQTFEDYLRRSMAQGLITSAVGKEEEWLAARMARRREAPSSFENLRDGRWFRVSEFRTPDGWLLHTATDITDTKEREAAMRRAVAEAEIANRAKMEFLAVMSHELRTPLNAIIGFSDVIRNRVLGDAVDTYMRYAEHINESGTHLLALINDLLDVSRIEAGRLDIEESDFNLLELMRECTRMLRVRADDKDVDLGIEAEAEESGLRADRRAVKQIILNLVSNAIKFTPSGGRVRLRYAHDDEGRVLLAVADTGIGIPPEQHETVFRPFEQLENAHARRHDGTGLGLFITRNLVEAHHGTIDLQSAPGEGTSVTVRFPAERSVPLPAEEQARASQG